MKIQLLLPVQVCWSLLRVKPFLHLHTGLLLLSLVQICWQLSGVQEIGVDGSVIQLIPSGWSIKPL